MPSATRSPRRLPARVYWFRRALVIGTALALVFAVAHLVGGGSDPAPAKAEATAGKAKPTTAPVQRPIGPMPLGTATAAAGGAPVTEVAPDGPCAVNDITVAPVAGTALGGRTVPLTLSLTGIRPACTFAVSSKSVVAKVLGSKGKIWSSQDCPSSVPTTSVVVRSAAPTTIQLNWNGRSSDETCSLSTDWAAPGTYQVVAAAIGSEPSQAAVKLTKPPRPVVVKTVTPKTKKTPTKKASTPETGHRRIASAG